MAKNSLTLVGIDTGVRFYHPSDERAFFEWLSRISCVEDFNGEGASGLNVHFKRRPGRDDMRQLLALCRRYGVDMRQLAKFETPENRDWFRDPNQYWHRDVFGEEKI